MPLPHHTSLPSPSLFILFPLSHIVHTDADGSLKLQVPQPAGLLSPSDPTPTTARTHISPTEDPTRISPRSVRAAPPNASARFDAVVMALRRRVVQRASRGAASPVAVISGGVVV